MGLSISKLTDVFSVAGQISLADIADIAAQGYKTLINNRPDAEGGDDQPSSAEIEQAACLQGLRYVYFPVVSMTQLSAEQIAEASMLFNEVPQPVLAFCRSGARSSQLYRLVAQHHEAENETLAGQELGMPADGPLSTKYDIVIVGGGSAGVGLAASLLKRAPNLNVVVIDPSQQHYYQPAWTLVGSGDFDIQKSVRPMLAVMPHDVIWIRAAVTALDPDHCTVHLDTGNVISYQYLVVASGLKSDWGAISGLVGTLGQHGVTSNYSFEYAPYTARRVQQLTEGNAIFTQPPMPIKCPGAPQKALYLSCHAWEKKGLLPNIQAEYHTAGAVLFSVPDFVEPLTAYMQRYQAVLNFRSNLIAVDGPARRAWFDVTMADGRVEQHERSFDLLHVVPPQKAHDHVINSALVNEAGLVDVDPSTLQHIRYPNVFSVGDVSSSPNSKTLAAARVQAVIVAENLLMHRQGMPLTACYNGYGACPLTVEQGRVLLAEFGYAGRLLPTFPDVINPVKSSRLAWILKKYVLPQVYWHLMLKGHALLLPLD